MKRKINSEEEQGGGLTHVGAIPPGVETLAEAIMILHPTEKRSFAFDRRKPANDNLEPRRRYIQ
jgi:hypothetical protein